MTNHAEQIEKSTKELARLEKVLVTEEKELEAIADSLKGARSFNLPINIGFDTFYQARPRCSTTRFKRNRRN